MTTKPQDQRDIEAREPVGYAGAMPGATGFTMACFKAADVPLGTALYARPAPEALGAAKGVELSEAEIERLRRISWLIGNIFVHGGFVAETVNERELESLLRQQGTFWDTLTDFESALAKDQS